MLIHEIMTDSPLIESVSLSSTLKILASAIGNPVTELYHKLDGLAEKFASNNDNMNRYGFVEKGATSKWMYDNGDAIIANLHHLADQAPSQSASALRQLLRDEDSTDFRKLARTVTPILMRIGRDVGYEHLTRNAAAWAQQEKDYSANLEKYREYAQSGEKTRTPSKASSPSMSDRYAAQKDQEAADKKAAMMKSRAQADELVNQVLKDPRIQRYAGEIRNAIAKDNNKLYALQRELAKRNITLESLR